VTVEAGSVDGGLVRPVAGGMRAVVCHELGPVGGLAVEDIPAPEPGRGEVRVAMRAAGVSFVTALQIAGKYQFPLAPPFVPGGEAAGVIEAVGEGVSGWRPGDRVFASVVHGAFAECFVVDAARVARLPENVDFARGASFMQAYGTAWFAFTRRTALRPGDVVLVTGAGGGVGLAAIDVARSMGAEVIAVASTAEKRELATSKGAKATIDPVGDDVRARVRELTGGTGVDVVYDVVGGDVSEAALRALAFEGRFIVIGFAGGIARVPLNLVLLNNRVVTGVEWGSWVTRNPEENRTLMAEVVAEIANGSLHPVVPSERPLDDAGSVLADLLGRRAVGKTVLVP